jgi:hypothetical protein
MNPDWCLNCGWLPCGKRPRSMPHRGACESIVIFFEAATKVKRRSKHRNIRQIGLIDLPMPQKTHNESFGPRYASGRQPGGAIAATRHWRAGPDHSAQMAPLPAVTNSSLVQIAESLIERKFGVPIGSPATRQLPVAQQPCMFLAMAIFRCSEACGVSGTMSSFSIHSPTHTGCCLSTSACLGSPRGLAGRWLN